MSILGIVIYIISLIGFTGMLRMMNINQYLSWITAMLTQTLIMYGFAMMKLLNLGFRVVIGLGISFFIIRLILILFRGNRFRFKYEGIHYFDIWMVLLGLLMIRILYASPLIHYDNYSHWALIVKFLLFEGHLPAAADASLVTFTSYPPEMALYITYFVKLVGFSDGAMIVGQFLIIWSSLYALFGAIRDRTRGLMSFMLCFVIAVTNVFNIAIRMNNLLVDYVLPVVAAAGIIGIYVYRKEPVRQCLHTMLFASALLLIKNSGGFYVAILAGFLLYQLVVNQRGHWWKRVPVAILGTALSAGVGFLPFYWWSDHVKTVFTTVSKHQISTKAYSHQLASEGGTVIAKIGHKFLEQIFSGNSLSTKGVLLINVTLLVAWLVIRFVSHKHSNLLKTVLAIDFVFVSYYISLFAMYVVSMPYAEAIVLDGFERYMSSMVILNLLIGVVAMAIAMDRAFMEQRIEKRSIRSFQSIISKNVYQISAFVLMIFSVIMMFSEINGIQYNNSIGENELPVQMTQIAHQSYHDNHVKILLVDPHPTDVDNYFAGYVGRYYFFSDKVIGQENFDMPVKQFHATLNQYQYVAIPEWHRTFTVMVRKVYHQHFKTGLYRVTPDKLVKVSKIAVK